MSGLLFSALGGAAGAGADMLQENRRQVANISGQKDMANFNDQLVRKREEAMAQLRQKYERDAALWKNSPEALASEATGNRTRAENTLGLRGDMAGKTAAVAEQEYDAGKGLRDKQFSSEMANMRAKSTAELETFIAKGSNPEFLKATRSIAEAGRDRSSDAAKSVQLQLAQLALDEKKAEIKMPPAVKAQAEALRDQVKAKSAIIDKAVADGTASPEGLKKLETERGELSQRITSLYAPYIPKIEGAEEKPPADPLAEAISKAAAAKAGAKPGGKDAQAEGRPDATKAPGYTPPAGSGAAKALQEREQAKARDAAQAAEMAKRRAGALEQTEEEKQLAAGFRKANRIQ